MSNSTFSLVFLLLLWGPHTISYICYTVHTAYTRTSQRIWTYHSVWEPPFEGQHFKLGSFIMRASCRIWKSGIFVAIGCFMNLSSSVYKSGTNRQNPFPLYLVKLRNRALKFLVHFSLVCLGKYPKAHEKWSQMEKPIWGSISHPSGMLWRPFRGRFLQILQPKGVFWSPFLCISCIYKLSKPLPVANEWHLQWAGVLTI